MSRTAYAVMVIDKKTRCVKGVGVFSDHDPCVSGMFTIALFDRDGEDYVDAHNAVLRSLDQDLSYAWLKPVVKWKRGELGRPGETVEVGQRLDAPMLDDIQYSNGELHRSIESLEERVDALEGILVP